ncbi:unnamed protein product [Phytophthora lilii]|uniref:Unnamed protein product n=1 Tax=Phytophthora lilii TaxID=2077276 RepID=A0A9W6T9W3_9STRA|nr:unnamed protein product [Phytophthora lilii]
MEAMRPDEVVREAAIFAALPPRNLRRERPTGTAANRDPPPADIKTALPGSLPPVNPRDEISILRSPQQLALPPNSYMTSLSPKTPQSLMMSVHMTANECWVVWKFLCDWVKTQVR